ncbi:MAG: AAA family ATPase [Paracoccaceae bacterium]
MPPTSIKDEANPNTIAFAMPTAQRHAHNLKLALDYAKSGIPVFPCKDGSTARNNGEPDRGPLTKKGFKDATTDPNTIKRMWDKNPQAVPGIPTGAASGWAVLDVDRKKGTDGVASLAEAGFDANDPKAVIVETPSGGLHLYYKHHEGLTNSTRHLKEMGIEGVDIRAEGGFVFAPDAINALGKYQPRSGDFEVDVLIGFRKWPSALRPPERDDAALPETQSRSDLTELRRALQCIPNSLIHEEWINVLAALHYETEGSKEGLAIANGWSAGYEGWSQKEVLSKWRSFGKPGGPRVTAGTIFKLAHDHGYYGRRVGPDDFLDISDAHEETQEGTALTFLSPAECTALPPAKYLARNIMAPGQVGCIFGEPGAGKSVLAPYLAYRIATGESFFGQATSAGKVWYITGEDELGMARRVAALAGDLENAANFWLVRGVNDLFSSNAVGGSGSPQLKELLLRAKETEPKLIVFDTLASVMPGLEENGAESMNRVVRIGREFAKLGATVIFVHHGTKSQGDTPRGHSTFNGALDFSILVKKANKEGIVRCTMAKNRNGPPDLDIAFRIGRRKAGYDVDGEPLNAPICEPCLAGSHDQYDKLTNSAQAALEVLEDIGGQDLVPSAKWKQSCIGEDGVSSAIKVASRETAFRRARRDLVEKGDVVEKDGLYRIATCFDHYEEDDCEIL